MSESDLSDDPSRCFEIVFVCTGNRARSAFAEAVLRRRLGLSRVTIRSVGTLDVGPIGALPEATRAATRFGIDLSAHRATALTPGALVDADLVIGFEPHHLSIAVVDAGARRERVFSIVELAEILETLPGHGEPGETIAIAHARRRATSPLLAPAIGDPLGKPERIFLRTFGEIDELTERIAARLFGVPAETD